MVSIRAPAWGATTDLLPPNSTALVSIRAPAWGATEYPDVDGDADRVSIRAPAWGATCQGAPRRLPRPVSIRAPAWGATPSPPVYRRGSCGFNSRSRVGSDCCRWVPTGRRKRSNSRSRVGSDAYCGMLFAATDGFNSRSRVGSDRRQDADGRGDAVSIRAPAWGATHHRRAHRTTGRFQFALPRGERRPWQGVLSRDDSFNSRSRVGSDAGFAFFEQRLPVSIRAPAWGATIQRFHLFAQAEVSIRAPAWGATRGRARAF